MGGARRCRTSASSHSPDGPRGAGRRNRSGSRRPRAPLLAAIAVPLLAWGGCAGSGGDAAGPAAPADALPLVNEHWRIAEMATAHGAFTVEVEVADGVDTAALARELIGPLQDRYTEVLVYFHARDAGGDLPRLRVQWTAEHGYVETHYR